MPTIKRHGPGASANATKATKQIPQANLTSLFREIISILTIGLLLAVILVNSVLGMSGQFGPTYEVGAMLAGVGADDQ